MEQESILQSIKTWLRAFVILFVVWCGLVTGIGLTLTKQIDAFNRCAHLEDAEFRYCYDAKQ